MAGVPPRGRTWACTLLVSLVLVAAGVAPAVAQARPSRDAITVIAPIQVERNMVYDVTIGGFSRRRARAYLFIDYARCAKSFATEQSRALGESDSYTVKGSFAETSGWRSSQIGVDHACAYLVSSAGTVAATAKRSYPVG